MAEEKQKQLRVTLKRSGIGYARRHRETLRGLGLMKVGKTVIRKDSPLLRGMIRKVRYLVDVQEMWNR